MIGEEDQNGVASIIIDEKNEKSLYRMRRIYPCTLYHATLYKGSNINV